MLLCTKVTKCLKFIRIKFKVILLNQYVTRSINQTWYILRREAYTVVFIIFTIGKLSFSMCDIFYYFQTTPLYSRLVKSMRDFFNCQDLTCHYAVQRPLGYFHHFLVIGWKGEKKIIIEYSGVSTIGQNVGEVTVKCIKESDIEESIAHKHLYAIEISNSRKTNLQNKLSFGRIMEKLGEKDYSLESNNCEHTASYILTGDAKSEQISKSKPLIWLLIHIVDSVLSYIQSRLVGDIIISFLPFPSFITAVIVHFAILVREIYRLRRRKQLNQINDHDYKRELVKKISGTVGAIFGGFVGVLAVDTISTFMGNLLGYWLPTVRALFGDWVLSLLAMLGTFWGRCLSYVSFGTKFERLLPILFPKLNTLSKRFVALPLFTVGAFFGYLLTALVSVLFYDAVHHI